MSRHITIIPTGNVSKKGAKSTVGVWRTTDDGSKVYFGSDGKVRGGGPKGPVLGGGSHTSGSDKAGSKKVGSGSGSRGGSMFGEGGLKSEKPPKSVRIAKGVDAAWAGIGLSEKADKEILAGIAGAPGGSNVSAKAGKHPLAVGAAVIISSRNDLPDGSSYTSKRAVYKTKEGETVIQNMGQDITGKGFPPGTGTRVLAAQVESARKAGVSQIRTLAEGRYNSAKNGYYTWPRLGFDGKATLVDKGKVQTVQLSDLMSTPEGREKWKMRGSSVYLSFDPSSGSKQSQLLSQYVENRLEKGTIE